MVGSVVRFFVLVGLLFGLPAAAATVRSGHMQAELVSPLAVVPGSDVVIGIRQMPDPGWHTYWINPGETGLAADVKLDLPKGITSSPIQWPVPERLSYSGVVTYGYSRPVMLLMSLHVPSTFRVGLNVPIKAHVESLVCQRTCEPVSFDLQTTLKAVTTAPAAQLTLEDARKDLPQDLQVATGMMQKDGELSVGFSLPQDNAARRDFTHPQNVILFSENGDIMSASSPQAISIGPSGFSIFVKGSHLPLPKSTEAFVLRFGDGAAWRINVQPGNLPVGSFDVGSTTPSKTPNVADGALLAIVLAFAGGLILNLMPCVFPVLSMKLIALTRAGHDGQLARRESLAYGVGAVLSFVVLSLLLDVARQMGASLGWGFQLQSPLVVALLSSLMLLVGLNMSGLFEVGASLQSAAGNQRLSGNPYLAAFMTGVLAVVVAAPCSAPFMATAMGVALAKGGLISVGIFTALGLGFAAPFVVLTFAVTLMPTIARQFPRPGPWMDRLRHVLAIPMYLATIWMIWVFSQQAGPMGAALLVAGLCILGISVSPIKLSKKTRGAAWIVTVLLTVTSATLRPSDSAPTKSYATRFSPQQIPVWRAQKRPILIDMTAAWCVTCKVNERVALTNPKVLAELKATNTVYMVGDWTHQDSAISDYIHQFGRSGVPLYVYYGAQGQAPVILPQILTPESVVKALQSGKN